MRLIAFFLIYFLTISCKEGRQSSIGSNERSQVLETIKLEPINFDKSSEMIAESKYWKIIENSFLSTNQYPRQKTLLLIELSKLSQKEIIGFDLRTTKLLKDSYSPNLWCAAYIMKGGCSDDAFEYFRCWLISQGKEVFYEAIENSDALWKLEKTFFSDYELEDFLYLPNEAFKLKTGKEIYDYVDFDRFLREEGTYPQIVFNWQEDNKDSMKKFVLSYTRNTDNKG